MKRNKVHVWQCVGDSDVHVLFDESHGIVLEDFDARYLCKLLDHLDTLPPEREPREPEWINIEPPSDHSEGTHICISIGGGGYSWHEVTYAVAESLRSQLSSICK